MRTRMVRTAVIMPLLGMLFMLPACKKQEAPMTGEQAREHVQEKLHRSFEESKKAVAVKVNGEAITEFFVIREMNAIMPRYLKAGQQTTPELDTKIRQDALDVLITQELAVQEAGRRGMKVQPQTIDDALAKIRKEAGSADAYMKYLANTGLTEDELRTVIGRDVLFEMIAAREVDARLTVTDADLEARYAREKAGLKGSAHRQMTFAEARPLLEQTARAEAAQKRMTEWEQELRKNARVEIIAKKQ